jgi:hypothetical protein
MSSPHFPSARSFISPAEREESAFFQRSRARSGRQKVRENKNNSAGSRKTLAMKRRSLRASGRLRPEAQASHRPPPRGQNSDSKLGKGSALFLLINVTCFSQFFRSKYSRRANALCPGIFHRGNRRKLIFPNAHFEFLRRRYALGKKK